MARRALPLLICAGLLLAAAEAHAADPVVLDAWNRYQTKIWTGQKNKKGWPWGWFPRAKFYVMYKGIERDDVLLVQHLKGKRKWGKPEKCRARTVWDKKRGIGAFECRGVEALAVNKPGRYGMRLTYKSMGAGKTFKDIASFSYKVIKYKKDNRHVKRRFKPSAGFVVDHDFRIGEAWLSEVDKGPSTPTQLRLRVWYKVNKKPHRPKVRCFFGDKKIGESNAERAQTTVEYRYFKKANKQAKPIIWAKHYWHFYKIAHAPAKKLVGGVSYPGVFYLNKNPGKYRCVASADGDTWATFFFEVGADGKVKRPACQSETAGNKGIATLDSMHLIRVKLGKSATIKYNKKAHQKMPVFGKKLPKGCLY
jgi:hypothetical protein